MDGSELTKVSCEKDLGVWISAGLVGMWVEHAVSSFLAHSMGP